MQNKLIILVGVDGMGKTTYANHIKGAAYQKGNDYIGKEEIFLKELINFARKDRGLIQVLDRVISIDKYVYGEDVAIDNGPSPFDVPINDQLKSMIKQDMCEIILFIPTDGKETYQLVSRLMSRGDEFVDVSNRTKTTQFVTKMKNKYIKVLHDLGFDGLYTERGMVTGYEK